MQALRMQQRARFASAKAVRPQVRRVALPRTQVRRAGLKVVAYRDVHREQQINDAGSELVRAWFEGIRHGPNKDVQRVMEQYLDVDIKYQRALINQDDEKGKGWSFLEEHLKKEHDSMHIDEYRILAQAACPLDDTYFALVEYKYTSKVVAEAGPCQAYKVLEFDVMYDDGARMITGIQERTQLTPEDVWCVASLDSAHALCSGTPFPEQDLSDFPKGLGVETVQAHQKAWCQARCSGQEEKVLDDILDKSFRLWDAYGMLPILCDPAKRAQPDACVVPYSAMKDIIHQTKEGYDIDCQLVDSAVSSTSNVGFTHWRSRITNRRSKEQFSIDGVEVEVFGADGKFKHIWLFRDPMDHERHILATGTKEQQK